MNENITCSIDCEKINSSINNLIPVYNLINNSNIYEGLQDVENKITKINLEHENCISNYKEQIRSLYNEIDILKKDINNLFEGLNYTADKASNGKINDINHIKKIAGYYQGTTASKNLFNLFKQVGTSISNTQEESYSTIPIGLGIASSGITAAAGTVLVDSMYEKGNNKNNEIEYLEEYETEDTSNQRIENNEEQVQKNSEVSKYEMDEIPAPYHASRDKIIVNKIYGEEDRGEEYEEI